MVVLPGFESELYTFPKGFDILLPMSQSISQDQTKRTVLIVDDTAYIRLLVRKVLEPLGLEILEAKSGSEALVILRGRKDITLVLMDVVMPAMDGIETLGKVRAGGNEVPVVMLTTKSGKDLVSRALSLGVKAYLKKPFEKDELRSRIVEILNSIEEGQDIFPGSEPRAGDLSQSRDSSLLEAKKIDFTDTLIVDPQTQIATFLEDLLEAHSHRVSVVKTFDDAVQIASSMKPDVILVNILYPEITKPEELASFKSDFSREHPVLMIAYMSDPAPGPQDLAHEFQPTGFFDAVCPKPFSFSQLLTLIEETSSKITQPKQVNQN